jgi:hypothetical protein
MPSKAVSQIKRQHLIVEGVIENREADHLLAEAIAPPEHFAALDLLNSPIGT